MTRSRDISKSEALSERKCLDHNTFHTPEYRFRIESLIQISNLSQIIGSTVKEMTPADWVDSAKLIGESSVIFEQFGLKKYPEPLFPVLDQHIKILDAYWC